MESIFILFDSTFKTQDIDSHKMIFSDLSYAGIQHFVSFIGIKERILWNKKRIS